MKRMCLLLAMVVLFGVVAGCGGNDQDYQAGPQRPSVAVQLAWVPTIEYAGLYSAKERGLYDAANLALTLRPLADRSPIDAVLAGEAQFGLTSADQLLLARAQGKPLVAVATIYQRSPVAFVSLAEKNIARPQDLIGKRVEVDLDGTTAIVYRALLASQGIRPEQVTTIDRSDYSNTALLSGTVDVSDAFINNQPVQLRRQGHAVNTILASDYGVELYPNVIFTTEDLIKNNAPLVAGFVQATVTGMQHAIDNVDEAAKLMVKENSSLDLASETESLRLALPLLNPAGRRPGIMQADTWRAAEQMLRTQGLLKTPLNVEQAYTLQFLEQAYAAAPATGQ